MVKVVVVWLFLSLYANFSFGQHQNNSDGQSAGQWMMPDSGQLMHTMQRVNDRLTAIETLLTQQMRKLDLVDYKMTKLEVLSQEHKNDKGWSEGIAKKIDDLEWEIHKFGTLLDVVRGDIDKIHQKQTELKISSTGGGSSGSNFNKKKTDDDSGSGLSEITSKVQVMSGHLNTLRRINEVVQVHLQSYALSLNNVSNVTREILMGSKQLLTKSYFHQNLQEILDRRPTLQVLSRSTAPDSAGVKSPDECSGWLELGKNASGVYHIHPQGSEDGFYVWCEMETEGGGWTVFQKRFDGNTEFYRDWLEYKHGFGNIAGEHWLGNEKLHILTRRNVHRLRIEMEDMDNDKVTAEYTAFAIGSQATSYALTVLGTYQGEAGDSFGYHAGMKFSTRDVDNDVWEGGSCAEDHKGGWWYKGCDMSNLNGMYLSGTTTENMQYRGMYWYEWHGPAYSVQKSLMMIRPAAYQPSVTNIKSKTSSDD